MHPFASISSINKKIFKELKGFICKIFRHGKTKKEYKEVQFQTTRFERAKEFDILCIRSLGFQGSFWEASIYSDYSGGRRIDERTGAVL